MDKLVSMVLAQLLANPQILQMAIGMAISVIVAKLKEAAPALDAAAKDPKQVKWVQILVMGLSLLGTLLTAWATGNLHGVDPAAVTAFLTTLATALAVHDVGTSVKKQVEAAKK